MHSAAGAVPIDFNSDGWVDLAVGYHKVASDHVAHSAIWWNGPDGFSESRTTLLPSEGPHGMIRVGTRNQRGGGPEEFYISPPCPIPQGMVPDRIDWDAAVPDGTWLKAQVRTAESQAALHDAPWHGKRGEGDWLERGQTMGTLTRGSRWLQYRLALGAPNGAGTPRVSEIRVSWRPE
jgi:hypothetical protein